MKKAISIFMAVSMLIGVLPLGVVAVEPVTFTPIDTWGVEMLIYGVIGQSVWTKNEAKEKVITEKQVEVIEEHGWRDKINVYECSAPTKIEIANKFLITNKIYSEDKQEAAIDVNYIYEYYDDLDCEIIVSGSYAIINEPGIYVVIPREEAYPETPFIIIVSDDRTVESPKSEPQNIKVWLNGEYIQFDQPPIIENGRTLVPLRAIFEALGATVDWDNDTQTVTAVKDDIILSLTIGSNILLKNGENITLDVPAQLVNGRTLVPARAVAESFGAKVDWDEENQTVIIHYN